MLIIWFICYGAFSILTERDEKGSKVKAERVEKRQGELFIHLSDDETSVSASWNLMSLLS